MTLEKIISENLRLPIEELRQKINQELNLDLSYDSVRKKRKAIQNETQFGLPPKEDCIEKITKETISDMKKYAPSYVKVSYNTKGENLLLIDPADIHIGKLSQDKYTPEQAVKDVRESISKILQKALPFGISKIMLVVGNDVLHVDNRDGTTSAGTKQDVDGLWHDNFRLARKMYVEIIESLRLEAPVHVVFNPSNHDYHSGFFLADTLECWFSKCTDVTFDTSMRHRKYFLFGKNLIMTSHGDEGKDSDYPYLMPHEEPLKWSKSQFRYVYLHHIHHKKTFRYKSGSDFNGITIEYLRSPSAIDSWHERNGYCTAPRAVEAFIHHPTEGQIARITNYI